MTESTHTPNSITEYGASPITFTAGAALKPGQDVKISGDMTVALATGLDAVHGRVLTHAESGENVVVAHHFRGGIVNAVAETAEITAGDYVKPTGQLDATTGLPEYEPEGVEKTQFIAVTGGSDGEQIMVGTL